MSIDDKIDGQFFASICVKSVNSNLRYAAGRRAATALRPFHRLRLAFR